MRHLTAVELDEGWRYASTSRRGGYPLGYCGDHYHPTESAARECFAQWQRDNVSLDVQLASWSDCSRCGAPAKTGAQIAGDGYALAVLCADHLTRADACSALGIDRPAGDSWVS